MKHREIDADRQCQNKRKSKHCILLYFRNGVLLGSVGTAITMKITKIKPVCEMAME